MVREINLNHICKIEGHAHLNLKIEKNKVRVCQLKAAEGARFFEALVLGKKIEDVQEIVSRICGICSSAHSVASVQALEEALSLKASETQKAIRELLMIGERIRSNATHLYFLALPDYLGFSSALSMGKKHQDKIDDALSIISLGNKIVECVGGREIHPFLEIKENIQESEIKEAKNLLLKIEEAEEIILRTIKIFLNLQYPKIQRTTDYLCLHDERDYATINGKITSNSGIIEDNSYQKHLKENIKEYATSKFVLKHGKPYVTGAVSRINNNHSQLDSESRFFLKNLELPLDNPFHNNIAQAIEILHLSNRAKKIIDSFEDSKEKKEIKIKAGEGVSAVEAPRGTLFHHYVLNSEGKVSYCNIITPTAQNLNMMEIDITNYVNDLLKNKNLNKSKITLEIEKLIRAYDPCFSCSTHFLKVRWL
jgi:sulfhydrogenase subunit alpha